MRLQPITVDTPGKKSKKSDISPVVFKLSDPEPEVSEIPSATQPQLGIPSWVPFVAKRKVGATTANLNTKQPIPFPADYTILGQVTLQLTDIRNNNNKYYALELHQGLISGVAHYRTFCHYGRTCDLETKGPNAGIKMYRYYSPTTDLETARV